MDIEEDLLLMYNTFIKSKSQFSDKLLVVPNTPQSFVSFPTIVFKESNNSDYTFGKTLNRQESVSRLTYQVEIYSKDIVLNGIKYYSRDIIKELKNLTHIFFNDIGFNRISSIKGEYIDITIDRHICLFEGKINNWNGKTII